ncbi:MAG: DNA gyrase/topoisomerase IV subunit A [Saprospiraceae bacterium]|nr:DNA gyrase/topoisomerase IV subunit A [Saprospiraceae bacterium]
MSEHLETGDDQDHNEEDNVITLTGMYENYFLDYASYVILERAVPAIEDGLKPVQRRILHAMREMEDGRYNKVANIIGQTMQYHPHGDAAIGDALVNLGQKNLLIDTQGNWGDTRTGDGAAASRYIEARLTKFALEVAFNPQTTDWQISYDGRKREPVTLPMKFPLLLAQGVEGIAVGLSTKIMPHNFIELIQASIKILQGKKVKIYPDFETGGLVDVSDYQGGKRGGKIKVRAKIEILDKKSLVIKDLPYGVTTGNLIDSIIKANEKGQIKIKKVVDNTAAEVEIFVELAPGMSPEVTMDALYAFTNCEVSISPNACVIIEDKPHFLTVEEILHICTANTKELLRKELEIKMAELQEKWHFASLEKIFIENRVYHEIEECETWEAVLETIDRELKKYIIGPFETAKPGDTRLRMMRDVTTDDIIRLTEIKIKRISKYNAFKADELIAQIEEDLKQVQYDLDNLTDFSIAYFQNLLDKYGKGRERKTEISEFDTIQAVQVVAANAKLYVNRKEGFIGTGLKKDEFVMDCSDIDDIIVIRKDGIFQVVRVSDKVFVGKDIIHVAVWKKGDERTTYNMVYIDGKSGTTYVKRFNVTAITREKEYPLTKGTPLSKVLYLTVNPNAEAEIIGVFLSPTCRAKIKEFDYDFGELAIKGRSSQGNILTKYPVRKIVQKELGESTLGAWKIWMDEASGRLNTEQRGILLGSFNTGDNILVLYKDGTYEVTDAELTNRYDVKNLVHIGKLTKDTVISAIHYEGSKGWTMVKRFHIETSTLDQKFNFISDEKGSSLLFVSTDMNPVVAYEYKKGKEKHEETLDLAEFIDVKGWKALGNKLTDVKLTKVTQIEDEDDTPDPDEGDDNGPDDSGPMDLTPESDPTGDEKETPADEGEVKTGDTIEFEIDGQGKLF